VHRCEDGKLYPYPAFFAVHKSLLKKSDSFAGSFKDNNASYNALGPFVRLPTTIMEVT